LENTAIKISASEFLVVMKIMTNTGGVFLTSTLYNNTTKRVTL